jgi:hypothetical protein
MAFHVTFRWGESEAEPTVNQMLAALSELDAHDDEHPDASLTHESEWCLSAFESGLLVWQNLERGEPRHMRDVPRDRVLQLWLALSRGDLSSIEKESWLPGYG